MFSKSELEEMKWGNIPEEFVVFDTETTGLDARKHRLLEIGAVFFNKKDYRETGEIKTFQCFIRQEGEIPESATKINGITNEMVVDGDTEVAALKNFFDFIGDAKIFAYNAPFDMRFLQAAAARNLIVDRSLDSECFDILTFARKNIDDLPNYKLATVSKHLKIETGNLHRAVNDSLTALQVYINLMQYLTARDTGRAIVELENMQREIADMERNIMESKARQASEPENPKIVQVDTSENGRRIHQSFQKNNEEEHEMLKRENSLLKREARQNEKDKESINQRSTILYLLSIIIFISFGIYFFGKLN